MLSLATVTGRWRRRSSRMSIRAISTCRRPSTSSSNVLIAAGERATDAPHCRGQPSPTVVRLDGFVVTDKAAFYPSAIASNSDLLRILLNQILVEGEHNGGAAIPESELVEHPRDVRFHRRLAAHEHVRTLVVCCPSANQP